MSKEVTMLLPLNGSGMIDAGRFDAGKRAEPRQELIEERDDVFVLRIGDVGQARRAR